MGTARKKENSAAVLRDSFCCIPPMIDAALLLTPGIIAMHCHKPIIAACLNPTSFSEWIVGLLKKPSMNKRMIPPSKREMETVNALSSNKSIFLEKSNPKIKAGITPTISFI